MNDLHVGNGWSAGALTVFPIWRGDGGPRGYRTDPRLLQVSEGGAGMLGGPSVSALTVHNTDRRAVLVTEGHLFEGGWQHRMATASVLVAPRALTPVEVACVEEGRWGGDARQQVRGRRATPFVRSSMARPDDVQGEVWRRVATYRGEGSANDTGSLVREIDRREREVRRLVRRLRPLPGQSGVLVGVAGQPLMLEVFDDPRTLHEQFASIVAAAGLDSLGNEPEPTPGRRARRLLHRLGEVRLRETATAGVAIRRTARTDRLDAAGIAWRGREVHLRATNLQHPLLAGVGPV